MSITEDRNASVRKLVSNYILQASCLTLTKEQKGIYASEINILNNLIPIKENGFRGIVLTSIIGKKLNLNFKPLEMFYSCKPRGIFEKGIYYALQEANIPCGKSDPLNVAKNVNKLDYDWAQGRKPESAAKAAVDYICVLEDAFHSEEKYEFLILLFFHELYKYGQLVNKKNVEMDKDILSAPLQLAEMLSRFVIECPEGGAVPQFIVGHLINKIREDDSNYLSVEGFKDSVFGTNTTSKKPADVWEITSNEMLGELYEITVKIIDYKRLDDCADSLHNQDIKDKVITFICNLPNDIESLRLKDNHLTYKGVKFQFIDITKFIEVMYCMLSQSKQVSLMNAIQEFVFNSNRKTKTKDYWKDHFS